MHELGVLIEVVKAIEKIAEEERLTKIVTLVLQIGELSSVIPIYVQRCYPAATDGTLLQDTKLKIEILPGNALCKSCHKVFIFLKHKRICPHCGSEKCELLSGREFNIKEIVAC